MSWTQDKLNLALKSNPDLKMDIDTDVGKYIPEPVVKATQPHLPIKSEELFTRHLKYREKVLLETVIQSRFAAWVRKHRPFYEPLMSGFAVPNGGKRPKKTAITMKKEGQEAGVPDYMILHPARTYSGLILETKTKYNQPTPEQIDWLNRLATNGFYCCVCWSTRDMIEVTTWFYNLPERLPED